MKSKRSFCENCGTKDRENLRYRPSASCTLWNAFRCAKCGLNWTEACTPSADAIRDRLVREADRDQSDREYIAQRQKRNQQEKKA